MSSRSIRRPLGRALTLQPTLIATLVYDTTRFGTALVYWGAPRGGRST